MGRVASSFPWQNSRPQNILREGNDLVIDGHKRECLEDGETFIGRLAVSFRSLIQNHLGDHNAKIRLPGVPPLPGYLLSTCHHQIAARPAHKVTGDRGF